LLYVVYLVIRERNFKDYNIAVFLGFFKYIGYLAFPIQMTHRYPALARFMAGHWATEAVHAVPVFGERGALLEHSVFNLFYNWPLTIRRRMQKRIEWRTIWRARGLAGTQRLQPVLQLAADHSSPDAKAHRVAHNPEAALLAHPAVRAVGYFYIFACRLGLFCALRRLAEPE
jgi:hypothetical protein